ncbi:hypothetical protein ACFQ07_13200, partial [Actinomadura adrarensis]
FVRVKPMTAAGTGGPVSVWVWVSSEANTKYRGSLKKCRVSFDALEDEAVCGPVTFRPPKAGNYFVAATAAPEDQDLPPTWPVQFTGVTTDLMHWNP